jgi:phytoene dehydrogenase-like protein
VTGAEADAVVVGGGHNGLICAAYLARAGMDVLVVEARDQVGGCAGTQVVLGARVNLCNCDHAMVRTIPLVDELGLADHGLRYVELDPGQVYLGWDAAEAVPLFADSRRTLDALSRSHPDQVEGYRRYLRCAVPAARLLVELAGVVPTRRAIARRVLERNPRAAATVLGWSRRSAGDVLRSFFTSPDLLGPAMAAGPAVWGCSPETPGTGLGALAPALKHIAPVGRPVGGSGALTDTVAAAIIAAGGRVRTGTRVAGILCEGERVRGVELDDGEVVEASVVVVACDPREALVRYLRDPPPRAQALIQRWRARPAEDGYESKFDARITALPRWRHHDPVRHGPLGFDDPWSPSTIVAPSLAEIDRGHALMADGRVLDRPILFVNIPSVLDSTVAPPGEHVFSLEVLFTPYALRGGWERASEPERWLVVACTLFEPGFADSVAEWRAVTPPHYERDLNLPRGHATSFAGGPLAALLGRDTELTRYRTPVRGLYLTGAATFPGAGVWGASGRNAASVVLARR